MISLKENLKFFLDAKQKYEFKKAFDLLDEGGLGTIDFEDIAIVIRALGIHAKPINISKLTRQFDPQNTGTLDFRAFLCIMEMLIFKQFTSDEIAKSFEMYCQRDCEVIHFDDFKRVANQLRENICEEDLQALFSGADLNNDGVIDFCEFSCILKRNPFSQNPDMK